MQDLEETFKKYCTNNLEVTVARIQEPLYLEKTNPLVYTITEKNFTIYDKKYYKEKDKDRRHPTIGTIHEFL